MAQEVRELQMENHELTTKVVALKSADALRDSAALIEDYFEVIDLTIVIIDSPLNNILISPFCVEGPSVLDFTLTGLFTVGIVVSLVIDDEIVAQAEQLDDFANPSQYLTLLYRGYIALESQVRVDQSTKNG